MLYLPETTQEAIFMEAANPDETTKWWIGAYAPDGSKDICFNCWGNHPSIPHALSQGKTLARGQNAKQQYRLKLEEKELKGYRIVSSFMEGRWINPKSNLPLPLKKDFPGQKEGTLAMSSDDKHLTLDLFRCPKGYRLDQREWLWSLSVQPVFPDWQTLYPTATAALSAVKAVMDNRVSNGYKVASDKIPWNIGEFIDPALNIDRGVISGWIQWDF